MRAVGNSLIPRKGILLHGAGLLLHGGAVAIVGPSGAGKSTAANLMRGDAVLSDDIVAVTDCATEPRLHGTPLGRQSDGPLRAPLRAVFFPRKATTFALTPVAPRDALIRSVSEQHDCLSMLFQPYGGEAFRLLYQLLKQIPAYELAFALEGGIDRDAILDILNRAPAPETR